MIILEAPFTTSQLVIAPVEKKKMSFGEKQTGCKWRDSQIKFRAYSHHTHKHQKDRGWVGWTLPLRIVSL